MPHRSYPLRDPRAYVVRRFAPGNLVIGTVATVGAFSVLYLFWGFRRIPIILLPLAALLLVAGLYLLVRPFADACAACGRMLVIRIIRSSPEALATATTALRSLDAAQALQALAPAAASGDAHAELRYCRSCGSAAMWRSAGGAFVLGGERAKAFIAALVPADPPDNTSE